MKNTGLYIPRGRRFPMARIAVFDQKGGVDKTTATRNRATALARRPDYAILMDELEGKGFFYSRDQALEDRARLTHQSLIFP